MPERTALTVSFNVNKAGNIYCTALPSAQGTLTGASIVKQNGVLQSVESLGGHVQLTIPDLSPSTSYDVYCYTEDFSAHAMPLEDVLLTRTTATTLCCAEIVFTRVPAFVVEKNSSKPDPAVSSSAFEFVVDSRTYGSMSVNASIEADLSVSSCSYQQAGVTPEALPRPGRFQYDGLAGTDQSSAQGSLIVFGTPGCFTLTANLYDSASGWSSTSIPVNIISRNEPPPPPDLQDASLSNDGLRMVVALDGESDRGVAAGGGTDFTSSFLCSQLLSFTGDSAASCIWTSDDAITATFNRKVTNAVKGDLVRLRSGIIRSKDCVVGTVPFNCSYADNASAVAIVAPSKPVAPTAILSASRKVSKCADIKIDPTGSFGSAGRNWDSAIFEAWYFRKYERSVYNYTAFDTGLDTLMATKTDTKSLLTVPSSLLGTGVLRVKLALRNHLGKSSQAIIDIEM